MRYTFHGNDFASLAQAEGSCWLLTNGLGGFMSASAAFSVTRCDQGMLVAAMSPSRRYTLVHRLREELLLGDVVVPISSQSFGGGRGPEEGWRSLASFTFDDGPEWVYGVGGVRVTRMCGMACGENASGVVYTVENASGGPVSLRVTPVFQLAQKGEPPQSPFEVAFDGARVTGGGLEVHVGANVPVTPRDTGWETLYYADDARDGRAPQGLGAVCCEARLTVPQGGTGRLELVLASGEERRTAGEIVEECRARRRELLERSGFSSPEARELARSADAFIAYRSSTQGKTVIAGYPFFGDWGRDTMIALPGCALSTGRLQDAASIIRTFLRYERDGLVPNYFPEGQEIPQYNSADAPLLLINSVWLYFRRSGDREFALKALPVVRRIVEAYKNGTRYAIKMDSDGLISAGEGLDQVTWMDVRVGDILPTPRHGKPVEINAYWYNALRVTAELLGIKGEDAGEYLELARLVKRSFVEKFWMEDRGYLRDVLSGTPADTQLRCNQIWAVTMPFSMLPPELEGRVVEAVYRHLYTPFGLRTLSPEDPEFHPAYGGPQVERDLAYHQGTVWPFPLGAWYLAFLKVHGETKKAAGEVRKMLSTMPDILREGCVGQIPEIYDGLEPGPSKGCFAQAWSVGELLRVYEKLEEIERSGERA